MARIRLNNRSRAPSGLAGKVFLSLFFLVFLAFGVFFCGLLLREGFQNIATWSWQETTCTILSSEISQQDDRGRESDDFHVHVRYEYSFGSEQFISDKLTRQAQSFSDYSKAARLAESFPGSEQSVCFVNPTEPTQAVLQKGSAWILLAVFFPLIFVAIGAGGIYFTWRRKTVETETEERRPISDRSAKAAQGRKFLIGFFGLFLLVGAVVLYFTFVRPVIKIMAAKHWPEVPCVVISSEVRSHTSDDGTTYSVNILFEYEFEERTRRSNRYSFMGGSSSGYEGKRAIVRQHPPGKETVCFVNPKDPTEAVLERGFTPMMWFGLIPLVFVLVGAGGVVHAARANRGGSALRTAEGRVSNDAGPGLRIDPDAAGSIVLKPRMAPWAKVLGALFFAAFWNGIVSVFVVQVVKSWQAGRPEWFLTVFIIPFVLIGLFVICLVFYYFLALFNPRPRLRVTPGAVRLGENLRVEWDIKGRTNVLERLVLRLEGREEATYRRGTRTYTDKNVFADLEIANTVSRADMRSGVAEIVLPRGLMHSFAASNNKIIWSLHLEGSIARWPDVEEEFVVEVHPARVEQQQVS